MHLSTFAELLRSRFPGLPADLVFSTPNTVPVSDGETPPNVGPPENPSTEATPSPVSQPSAFNTQPPSPRRRWKRYARQVGRPTLLTAEIADAMDEAILRTGITDCRAANLVKVSRTTVTRWKQEDPTFVDFLETARTQFMHTQLTKLLNT